MQIFTSIIPLSSMLQDMIVVAINDAMNKIDKETENKMGKYTQGMPGLF